MVVFEAGSDQRALKNEKASEGRCKLSDTKDVRIQIGPGLPGILAAVFITLKLLDKIDWSWWWVTSPLWIPAGVALAVAAVALLIAAVAK